MTPTGGLWTKMSLPVYLPVDRPAASRLLLDSKNYSSNVLVLEYSFNSTLGRKFQFPVPVFQINEGRGKEGVGKGERKGRTIPPHFFLHFEPWSVVYSRSHAACIKHFRY